MNNPSPDANIPILTEIISAVPATPIITPQPVSIQDVPDPSETMEERRFPTWTEKDLQQLENILNERVLRQVQGRIDFVLEHRVRDSLADALQVSIEGLTAEIRRGLHQTLGDVIARAVSQELARMQAIKK